MKIVKILFLIVLFFNAPGVVAQEVLPQPPNAATNPIDNISTEITKISKSLTTFNKRIKELLDQTALNKGFQLNEKQQKLIFGFEILNRAEQRLEILQKAQIELAEKESAVKTRLAQVEQNNKAENIDRSVAFLGTTKTEETRESKRRTMDLERASLQGLLSQIQRNLLQNNDELRQAEILVKNLRQKILPKIELELSEL